VDPGDGVVDLGEVDAGHDIEARHGGGPLRRLSVGFAI
jgi:hypothetical protein